MAIVYSTGQVYVFVAPAFASPSQASFLGTVETEPEIQLDRQFSPVFNDIGGRKVPFDMIYDGKQAFVFLNLNRFNYPVYAGLEPPFSGGLRENFNLPYLERGTDIDGNVGGLMIGEEAFFTLYLQFAYGTKLVFAANSMPLGWRFPTAIWRGPDRQKCGTRDHQINTIIHCLRLYDPSSRTQHLFDHNIAGLPAIN